MSEKTKSGKMRASSKNENSRPAPYKVQLRKFAKPSSQNNPTTNLQQTATAALQSNQGSTTQTIPPANQMTQLASDVREYYTNLKNPLSYSGNADEILNKIKSYK